MQHIQGISRNQLQVSSLEDTIAADNPVRFIDAFVGSIDLEKLGFSPRILKTEGRPSFDTQVFLKIYLYGYSNGIRSSRRLEKECLRNLEMQWLLQDIFVFSFVLVAVFAALFCGHGMQFRAIVPLT